MLCIRHISLACKVKRSQKRTPALQGSLHQPPTGLSRTALVCSCSSLKTQLRSACSYSVTTRFSLLLRKRSYFHVSCWIQNGKSLLRGVHRTLLFQQKSKETPTFVPLYRDPLTKKESSDLILLTLKHIATKKTPKTFLGKKKIALLLQTYLYR